LPQDFANARVALLWQTDVEPARVNKRPLEVEAASLPADLHRDPHWLGCIVDCAGRAGAGRCRCACVA
jgi:hypothetical protein